MVKYIIAIDPDVDASGIAILSTDGNELRSANYTFGEVVSLLQAWREKNPLVVVEAGWLNIKTSWHCNPYEPNNVSAKKGHAVGRNQQVGHDIVEVCKVFGLHYMEQTPLRKCWRGKDGKITHEELAAFVPLHKKRTNQDERDAILLAWVTAGLPIRIRPK